MQRDSSAVWVKVRTWVGALFQALDDILKTLVEAISPPAGCEPELARPRTRCGQERRR